MHIKISGTDATMIHSRSFFASGEVFKRTGQSQEIKKPLESRPLVLEPRPAWLILEVRGLDSAFF